VRRRLIVFTRWPEPGRVKTRLAAAVGAEEACWWHERLLDHTLAQARAWGGEVQVRVEGGAADDWDPCLGGLSWRRQGEGALGERIERALGEALREGAEAAVLVGSDCPGLDVGILAAAFAALEGEALVFGPARDGGYYLVGVRGRVPPVFEGVPWGGATVLRRSLELARSAGVGAALLTELANVDVEADLEEARRLLR